MITGAIFRLLAVMLGWLSDQLPVSGLTSSALEDAEAFGEMLGERAGPFDAYLPLVEMMQGLVIWATVWVPACVAYTVAVWIFKHLPVIGKG